MCRVLSSLAIVLTLSISPFLWGQDTTQETAAVQDSTEYWPQWRGPLTNGVAPKGNPPTTWSEQKNIKWKVKLPGRLG